MKVKYFRAEALLGLRRTRDRFSDRAEGWIWVRKGLVVFYLTLQETIITKVGCQHQIRVSEVEQ